jgi:hypothetical protein
MGTALRVATVSAIVVLGCVPGSAGALTFVEALGSPYQTTDQHFSPNYAAPLGGLVAGDFNRDGVSDLAVVNATGLPAFSAGESVTCCWAAVAEA